MARDLGMNPKKFGSLATIGNNPGKHLFLFLSKIAITSVFADDNQKKSEVLNRLLRIKIRKKKRNGNGKRSHV